MATFSEIVSDYLKSEIARGSFPSAQYVIGENLKIVAEDALGFAVIEPVRIPATLDTIYDLASLTKPLVTSLLIVMFAERGLIDLKNPVAEYLSEFDVEGNRDITLVQLLTHTSGLPSWQPLYLEAETRERVPAAIARILAGAPAASPASEVLYSDLNYILLGFVLERISGERLDRLARTEIFDALGLRRTMFNPPPELISEIAATEHGQAFELANAVADVTTRRRMMGIETPTAFAAEDQTGHPADSPAQTARWRKDVIRGEVHDGNAYFMGGVAGHAGLFSTAREAFRLVNQFLPGSELLKPQSLRLFRENLTPGCATSRSIAWILGETPDCSAGPALAPTAFGHNGFTGTSIWVDPDNRRAFVLLTNRVHPRVDAIDMREIRRRFNALAVGAVKRET